jgi:hypothetical protein
LRQGPAIIDHQRPANHNDGFPVMAADKIHDLNHRRRKHVERRSNGNYQRTFREQGGQLLAFMIKRIHEAGADSALP